MSMLVDVLNKNPQEYKRTGFLKSKLNITQHKYTGQSKGINNIENRCFQVTVKKSYIFGKFAIVHVIFRVKSSACSLHTVQ